MADAIGKQSSESQPQSVLTVAIVEDVRSLRESFGLLIDGTPGFQCTASFRSMEEALDRIAVNLPDVLLADIGLPGMSGIEGIRLLKERYPQLTVLMLTVYDDNDRICRPKWRVGSSNYSARCARPNAPITS